MGFTVVHEDTNLLEIYSIIRNLPTKKYNAFMVEVQRVINNETGKFIVTDALKKSFENLGK
jgi:type IV secretory pathway component VirB8